ncbi:MAG: 5,10-methylenetetrahydrofolate reductase [Bacteroidetes bacterium]|nr:5,10-methylenetetrahydrofolate reductase [Bacteroidota bacterium]
MDIPEELAKEVANAKDNISIREIGIDWAIMQANELKKANVPSIHFYTMGKADNIYRIAQNVF